MNFPMSRNLKRFVIPSIALVLMTGAVWLLHRELAKYSYREIREGFTKIPPLKLFLALGFTALNYWTLTFYDLMAIRYLKKVLSYPKILLVSFTSYVMSYNLSLSSIGGTAIRFRLYSRWGFAGLEIAQIVAFCAVSFWCGFGATCAVGFLFGRFEIPDSFLISAFQFRLIGGLILTLVVGYLWLCVFKRSPVKIRNWSFTLPSLKLALGQIVVGVFNVTLGATVLFLLLPEASPAFTICLGIYLVAMFAGIISHVPGGIGVFDTAILLMLAPWVAAPEVVAALVTYRAIYYLLPLLLALLILTGNDALHWRKQAKDVQARVLKTLPLIVPLFVSLSTLVAGILLLFTGATPSFHGRIAWLDTFFPLAAIEFSHFVGSLIGVLLLFLARGLFRRIDSAYVFTLMLVLLGAVASIIKGEFGAGIFLLFLVFVLLPCRSYFHRKASLMAQPLTIGWIATYLAILVISIWLGLFSFKNVGFSTDLWWKFAMDGDASRYLRASVGAVMLMGFILVARLFSSAKPKHIQPTPEQLQQIKAAVEASPVTEANLALLGDKSFLFSPSGKSFIMYAVEGESWIAMGDPVGDPTEFEELIWKFREASDQHNDWPVFYGVSTELLPLYLDGGFSLTKIGEEAVVPLTGFSLEGSARKRLRATVRKSERDGSSFEIIPREAVPTLMPHFKSISDQWLGDKQGAEKGFSLGFFSEPYLLHYNFAVVKFKNEIVAFANLWEGGGKEELSVDLMRFSTSSPEGCMEYLFTKLMLWSSENGYKHFGLGAAPLSGLDKHPLAPLWSRIGAEIYEHGEHFYNFQGLRAYKEKFDPIWRPRYLATLGGLNLPRVLTNIATLVAGGWKEMLFRK